MLIDHRTTRIHDVLYHPRQFHPLLAQLQLAGRNPARIEQVIDQPHQLVQRLLHHGSDILGGVRVVLGQLKNFQTAADWGKRIAQLVGQHGEEFVLSPVTVLQRFFHSAPLGNVVKNHHRAGNLSCGTSDGRRAVFNASLRAIFRNQGGVISQTDHSTFPQNLSHRIFRRLASFFVNDR